LAAEQCRVVLADQNVEAMEEVAKGFLGMAQQQSPRSTTLSSSSCCIVECNVTDSNQVKQLMEEADDFAASSSAWLEAADSSATLFVNCAGIT
jgi:NAD(P)-dependent dehydrogenase (short-subunit alcohol dehydrogenase family)